MAFPHSLHPASAPQPPASPSPGCQRIRPERAPGDSTATDIGSFIEGGHQLEKLEFALAVANSRGDQDRVLHLRSEILALGGNREEPGT